MKVLEARKAAVNNAWRTVPPEELQLLQGRALEIELLLNLEKHLTSDKAIEEIGKNNDVGE